jgi:hypothetical protein
MDSFRTKIGRCHVSPDGLEIRPDLAEAFKGYGRRGLAVAAVSLLAVGAVAIAAGQPPVTVAAGLAVGVGLMVASVGLSYVQATRRLNDIPLHRIDRVQVKEGRIGFSSPRFVVHHDTESAETVRYLIMHSLWFERGREEFRRGQRMFQRYGVPLEGAVEQFDEEDESIDDPPDEGVPAGIDYDRYERQRQGETEAAARHGDDDT